MEVTIKKKFFSKHKLHLWLDSLGQKGYLLIDKQKSRYTFTVNEEHSYYYSVDYLDFPADSDEAEGYCNELIGQGLIPAAGDGRWIYIASEDKPFENISAKLRKNSIPYLVRSAYIYFFTFVLSVICGYQFHEIAVLKSAGSTISPNVITEIAASSNGFLNVLISIVNFFIRKINWYFGLWFEMFGYRGAVAVIAVMLPVIIILAVIGGINFAEYIVYRKEHKKALSLENEETAVEPAEIERAADIAEECYGE